MRSVRCHVHVCATNLTLWIGHVVEQTICGVRRDIVDAGVGLLKNMIRYSHATSDTTTNAHSTCASNMPKVAGMEELVIIPWQSCIIHHPSSISPPQRAASASLDYCSREKHTHRTRRDAVLSALGDGETTFQISDTTRSAAYLVTKQECCLQVSNRQHATTITCTVG